MATKRSIAKKPRRGRVILVGQRRFVSERPGKYVSTCRRWGIFHMMAGTVDAQWELFTLTASGDPDDYIEGSFSPYDFNHFAERGELKQLEGEE